jgi:thiol:disulfide interchange protein
MSEDDQLFLFKKGLNRDMQQYLLLVRPKTLAEAQALAVRFEAENPYKHTNNYNGHKQDQQTYTRQPFSQSSSSSSSTPMELGRIQQQEQESTNDENTEEEQAYQQLNAMNKKLTPEETEEYKRQGKCFRCGKQGHISRNCPTRNNQNTRPQAQGKK